MFQVGWFGYGGSSGLVEFLLEDLELAGIKLSTCHEYPIATVKYTPDGIYDFIDSCDIIILPARLRLQPAKSVNRLALAWSKKKACVVAPLDSYMKYVEDGVNAIVANTKEEWLAAIFKLRDNISYRNKIAQAGYKTAITRLNPKDYSDKFFAALDNTLKGKSTSIPSFTPSVPSFVPFVQVIIPHYADRLDYLNHAVESVALTQGLKDILVVSSSKINPETSEIIKKYNARVVYSKTRLSFSEANNLGIKNANQKATHFLLMNDDVILNETALKDMVSVLVENGNNFILNPYSNCDKGWLHNDCLTTQSGKDLHPNMLLEDFNEDELSSLRSFGFTGNKELEKQKLKESPFCAFYCTLIPKEVVEKVGMLSTLFKNGGEDLDYCERAKRFGFGCFWTSSALCFHFGGKTRKFSENEDHTRHHEEDAYNNLLVKKRWGNNGKKIGIWTGPAWETWDLDSYTKTGIGGSESAAGRLAVTAAANGYSVYMYGSHERKEQYGVEMVPWDQFVPEEEYFDLFIASRNVNCIDERLRAKNILVWIHDIWLLSGKEISPYHLNRVTKFVCLTPWHKDFVSNHHSIPKDKIVIIPNGINTELFKEPNIEEKTFGKLIYSSSPDRGLDNLLYLLPFVREKVPEVHLDIYYGFYNYESAIRSRSNPEEVEKMEKIKELINKSKDFATLRGRVSQPELAEHWHKAYLWFYPTSFWETYCITAKEAQLSATPILCSNEAALKTTVGEYGIRVDGFAYSYESRVKFVDEAIKLLQNKDYWLHWSKKSHMGSQNISWENRWEQFWKTWL